MTKASVAFAVVNWLDRVSGYLLGFATTCTATAIRFGLEEQLRDRSRLLLLIPAVLITAWYGGVGPGVFALLFGAFLCAWVLIPPVTTVNFGDRAEQLGMLLYLAVGVGIIVLVHRERQEKTKREVAQKELQALNATLEARVQERTRELEVANRELESFCYSVSHDLRTPSRAIVGNIHILLEDHGGGLDDAVREKLNRVSRAALKLSDLVDALLTYARLAKAGLRMEIVDLGTMIAAEVHAQSTNAHTKVLLDKPAELKVIGDKAQIRTAVEALVSNALTYRGSKPEVHLSVDMVRAGTDVTIRFSDDGIGFDPTYLGKVFLPFERLHRDDAYPGVGMGLANVARIAERHNGAIWAESTPGQGSTFFLKLGNQQAVHHEEPHLLSA